jgi:two-component sensor histidine kinase
MSVVSTAIMSSKDLIHSVNNQLAVVMAQAEILAKYVASQQDVERCLEIKQAATKINRLLRAFSADSAMANF